MSKYTIIKCGRLYTGRTDDVLTGMQILVEDDRIREVDKAVTAVPGAEWIDLSDAFVTPGLIDAHVHYSFTEWRTRMHDSVYEAPIYKGMYALHNARKSLARGFTAVRHCGSNCDDRQAYRHWQPWRYLPHRGRRRNRAPPDKKQAETGTQKKPRLHRRVGLRGSGLLHLDSAGLLHHRRRE